MNWQRIGSAVGLSVVTSFCLWHLSLAIPYAFHDLGHSDVWHAVMQPVQGDEIRNRARAQSLIEYTYRTNPILEREEQHVYLRIGSWLTSLVPDAFALEDRVLLTLRVLAASAFALAMLGAYLMFRVVFDPWISLALWGCFAFGSADYLHLGYLGKEDSLCLLIVEGAFAAYLYFWRDRRPLSLWICAALIGLGAATKQYPLLMMPALLPAALSIEPSRRRAGWLFFWLCSLVGVIFLACNPNFFLSPLSNTARLAEYYLMGPGDGVNPDPTSRLLNAWSFFRQLFLVRYLYVWFSIALLVAIARWKGISLLGSLTVRRAAPWVLGWFVFYYAACLYKVQIIGSVRYFLIGELATLLLFGFTIRRLAAFDIRHAKLVASLLALVLMLAFPVRRSQGSFHAHLWALQANVLAAKSSTWAELLRVAVRDRTSRGPLWIKSETPDSIRRGGMKPFSDWESLTKQSTARERVASVFDPAESSSDCFVEIARVTARSPAVAIDGIRSGTYAMKAAFSAKPALSGPTMLLYRNDCFERVRFLRP